MRKYKLNEHNLNTILCNINKNNILNHNTSRIDILNNKNTLRKVGVGIFEVEDNNMKQDLFKEEAKSYVIIVGIHDIFPNIVKVL